MRAAAAARAAAGPAARRRSRRGVRLDSRVRQPKPLFRPLRLLRPEIQRQVLLLGQTRALLDRHRPGRHHRRGALRPARHVVHAPPRQSLDRSRRVLVATPRVTQRAPPATAPRVHLLAAPRDGHGVPLAARDRLRASRYTRNALGGERRFGGGNLTDAAADPHDAVGARGERVPLPARNGGNVGVFVQPTHASRSHHGFFFRRIGTVPELAAVGVAPRPELPSPGAPGRRSVNRRTRRVIHPAGHVRYPPAGVPQPAHPPRVLAR